MAPKCKICGRDADKPYRRIVGGRITEGCVARAHDGHLPPMTNTFRWHEDGRKALGKARH